MKYIFNVLSMSVVIFAIHAPALASCSVVSSEPNSREWTSILDIEVLKSQRGFLITGDSHMMDTNEIYFSETGMIWRPLLERSVSPMGLFLYGVNNYWVFSLEGDIYKSLTGLSWSKTDLNVPVSAENDIILDVISIDNLFFVLKIDSLLVSDGLETWNVVDSVEGEIYDFLSDSSVNGKIFLRTEDNVFVTNDGFNWSRTNLDSDLAKKVIWAQGRYLLLRHDGIIMQSYDGIHWQEYLDTGLSDLNDFLWIGEGTYIVIGNCGLVASNEGGKEWEKSEPIISDNLNEIVWNGSVYVAYGRNKKQDGSRSYDFSANIIVSKNGKDWFIAKPPSVSG